MSIKQSELDIAAMQQVFDEADCLFTYKQVHTEIERVAKELTEALHAANPLILVVMNGGLLFAGQLLPNLMFPLQIDYLHASRYGDKTAGDKLEWRVAPATPLTGRTVLVVDDILDEGYTLNEILDFCEQQGAKQIYTAVLAEKIHHRKASKGLSADFCGVKVEDRFVFGFGMDYRGYWRNAPGIYAVKGL